MVLATRERHPAAPGEEGLLNQDSTPSSSSRAPQVFILDDDAAVRDSLELLLGLEGYRTQVFDCVARFLEGYIAALTSRRPDCVILDVNLPDGNGRAVMAEITARSPSLPVILMSGQNDGGLGQKALAEGAFAFLEKPLRHNDLFDALARALTR